MRARRKRSTVEAATLLRARIKAGVDADHSLKYVAFDVGVSHCHAARVACAMGYRHMLVTDAERAMVLASRRAAA